MIDGRTLVGDLDQSIGLALGLDKQFRQNRAGQLIDQAINAPDEEVMGLVSKIAQVGGTDMAQGVMQMIQSNDQRELAQAQQQAREMQVFSTKLRNIKDHRDRRIFISNEINRRASEGLPYDKLLEPANMDFEQQNFWATQNMITADNVGKLVDRYLTPPDPFKQAELDLKRDRLGLDREKLDIDKGKLKLERDKLSTGPKVDPKVFEQEQKLRKEVNDITKDYRKINDSYGRIRASVQDPSAAGDLALIFNYMKMLDPGSVVRESEFATAQNAGGVPARVRATFNKLIKGERLDDTQRDDFFNRSNMLYTEATKNFQKRITSYRGIAERAGLDSQNVITKQNLYSTDAQAGGDLSQDEQAELEALRKEQGN